MYQLLLVCLRLVFTSVVLTKGEYIDFDVENKKSYDFKYQHILYPCSKLYEYCGDYECCPGLQCTDGTFEEDDRDFFYERFFCGNASKTYSENVKEMHAFVENYKKSEELNYLKKYADPDYPDLYNSTLKSLMD